MKKEEALNLEPGTRVDFYGRRHGYMEKIKMTSRVSKFHSVGEEDGWQPGCIRIGHKNVHFEDIIGPSKQRGKLLSADDLRAAYNHTISMTGRRDFSIETFIGVLDMHRRD